MALQFQDKRNLAQNQFFLDKVEVALVQAALAIASEDPAAKDHDRRVSLAREVLIDSPGWARRMALAVAVSLETSDKDAAEIDRADIVDDAALSAQVAAIWGAFLTPPVTP
ncbi:MAG: hypothetical protein IT437_08680 [Phycisphaerales bacterium]|nr:hypothetical protein [Phycisphaerales bacterium]